MAPKVSIFAVLALFVAGALAIEQEREGWFIGPAGETKPYSPTIIQVTGSIFCQKGGKLTPIAGAFAKVTCAAKGKKPFTIISQCSDKKGVFTIPIGQQWIGTYWTFKKDCKAYLHASPLKTCNIATNYNKGLTGASLTTYTNVDSQHLNVYKVGPFIYKGKA